MSGDLMFLYSDGFKRYYTLDYFYKNKFKCKIAKVSLNAGFTCPNMDGTLSNKGCIYCSKSGSGEFAGDKNLSIEEQFYSVKKIMDRKWPNSKYIAYFQARTNTYAPLDKLKKVYESVLELDNVVGISIATRPDSISLECLDYLEELSKRTFLTVELGLQTINNDTSILINRCHTLECFDNMVYELKNRGINVLVHIINGLPYETSNMMLDTVRHLNKLPIDGIKFHMLCVLKNTPLEKYYEINKFHILSKEEYIDIVCNQLEILRPDIVVNRITSDTSIDLLIEPMWIVKKRCIINDIDKELRRRNTYQGIYYNEKNSSCY